MNLWIARQGLDYVVLADHVWHLVHSPQTQGAQDQIFASKPVAIIYPEEVGTMTSHSHNTDSKQYRWPMRDVAMASKQDVRGCLSTAVCPKDHHNTTLYYQY